MKKKVEPVDVHQYNSMLRGLVLSLRAQPVDRLWVTVCRLKYDTAYPYEMIDEARRIVLNEQETVTN